MKLRLVLIFGVIGLCGASCAPLPEVTFDPSDPMHTEAKTLLSLITFKNSSLNTFKGLGNFKLRTKDKLWTGKIAWLGESPDRLRIEILEISGQPMLTISMDGKYIYMVSHPDKKFYKHESADPELEQFLSIPIRTKEVISLLSGRIPIHPHQLATLEPSELPSEHIIVLKDRRDTILERIYLDKKNFEVHRVEMFYSDGTLKYSVLLNDNQYMGNYEIPYQYQFEAKDSVGFHLRIRQYTVITEPVSPLTFVLTAPRKGIHDFENSDRDFLR